MSTAWTKKDPKTNSVVRASQQKIYTASGKKMAPDRNRQHYLTHVWKMLILTITDLNRFLQIATQKLQTLVGNLNFTQPTLRV
jgi:hypothetical protein